METDNSFEEILEDLIQRKEKANTDNICELAEILDLNLKTDLAGVDLNLRDLSGGDLQGVNLRFTKLSSAKLIGTNLRGADLSYADIRGADFTDADLTGTVFHEVKAQNAIFCNNQGMYEGLKLDLQDQGAIFTVKKKVAVSTSVSEVYNEITANAPTFTESFSQYQGKVVEFADNDLLNNLYQEILSNPQKFAQYEGKYIAVDVENLKIVAENEDKEALEQFLYESPEYCDIGIEITKVTEIPKISEDESSVHNLHEIKENGLMFKYDDHVSSLPVPVAIVEVINSKNGKTTQYPAIIATGADVTCIPETVIQQLALHYTSAKVRDFNDRIIQIKRCRVDIKLGEHTHSVNAFIVRGNEAIIGRDILNQHKLILDAPNKTWSIE